MALTPETGTPSTFESGNTVLFTESFADYPVGTWTDSFVLSLNGGTPVATAATTSGSLFLVTLSAAVTAALTPGIYDYAHYVTSGSERATAKTGTLKVLPNLAVAQTPSFAAAQVTLLKVALAALNTTDKVSVNFNGQSFTRANIAEYQKQLIYWEARVIRENAERDAARGTSTGGRIAISFK